MSAQKSTRDDGQPSDEHLLAAIRSVFEAADPVPVPLADRIRFLFALAGLDGDLDSEWRG